MAYSGSQWVFTGSVINAPAQRYDFAATRIAEIEDWGHGQVYTFIPHLAEKEWVDLDDFVDVFRHAWRALEQKLPRLDETILDRSIHQALIIRKQLGLS